MSDFSRPARSFFCQGLLLTAAASLMACAANPPAPAPAPAPVAVAKPVSKSTPASKAAAPASAKASTSVAASATKPASDDDSVVVCDDEASTGSNIRKHKCYRETAEMRRQKQEQIDALHRAQGANSGPTNF